MEAPTRPTVLLPVTTLAVTSNGEIPHIPTRAASIASKSSRKKRNRKKRARQWTYYIDTLKSAIDGLYEICRSEHSVAGCREAMLYLQSASNDFKSLIESINVEVEFTTASNEKRPSVAWEIRKSMSSPSHMVINEKLVNNSPLLPISVLAEAVRNANVSKEDASDQSSPAYLPIKDLNPNNISYARITAAAVAVVAAAANASEQHHEDGWQVVRSRRRKSASSTTASEFDREMSLESDYAPTVPLNVYERLSSGIGSSSCRRGKYSASSSRNIPSPTTTSSARLTCPRSAMDLPQTKASMAKMAYSRQLLWEKNQHALYEKLRARQKREKVATNTQHHQSSTSLTVVATTEPGTHVSRARSTCGFTFADPLAVRKSVEAYTQQKRQQQHKQKAVAAPEAEHALQSINENDEPATSAAPPEAKELMSTSMTSDEVPADPKPKSPEPLEVLDQEKRKELPSSSQSLRAPTPGSTSSNFVEGSTTSAPAVLLLETSAAFVEDDVVWREMTEEEESLALEENSLKFEIEKAESLSFDVELEKQVCSEAAQLEKLHRREKRRNVKRSRETEKEARNPREMRHFMPPPSDATPLEYEGFYKAFQEELQTLATVAWSELMNQSVPMGPVHEPGTLVERHEKMSSPSRRKCDKDDDDFGRRHEEKLRRADELRSQLQEERAARVKELTKRVEEVRAKKLAIQEKKRKLLEERMQRATENRETHLTEIVRKAKDDDQKVHEVLFINTLQGDAKRHELMMKTRSDDASHEEKKKQLADERARKMEEKAAKEAAAVARRREVAMARENRLKSLVVEKEARISQRAAEQEEKKRIKRESTKNGPKASVIPTNPNIAETTEKFDENEVENVVGKLLGMVAAMTNEPVAVKGNTDKWSAIVDPAHWPSQKSLNFTKNCKICQVKLNSEFDVMAHLLSKNHVEKSKTLKVSCKISDYKKQEDALVQLKTAPLEKIETGNFLDGDENLANATEKMNKLQTRTAVPLPLSSPRARLRQIRDIANIFDKMSGCSIVDETTQKSMEKVLGDLLSSFEKSDGNESAITAEQLCAVGGVLRICDALLAWTKNSTSLRLCVKYAHFLSVFVRDIRVAYTILYQNQLMKIVELIVHLLTNEPTAPQLSALLDVLNALLQTVVGRISTSTDQKTWKELKSLDSNAPETIDVIAGFYRCSLKSSTIVAAVEATNGVALISRLNTLFSLLLDSNNGRLLYSTFMRIALEHALKCGRSASNGPRDQKIATDVAVIVVRALESLSSDLKFEDVWKTIVENGQNALMIRLILSNVLRSAISAATASEPPKNARHRQNPASSNNFTTSEAELVKLLEFIACFANAGNQNLCLLGSRTMSITSQVAALPLRWLVVSRFADHSLPTLIALTAHFTPAIRLISDGFMDPAYLRNFVEKLIENGSSDRLGGNDLTELARFYKQFTQKS